MMAGQSAKSMCLVSLYFLSLNIAWALKPEDCEVCIGVMTKLGAALSNEEKTQPKLIEEKFREICKDLKKSENRFCYYIGGLEESATSIVTEMSKPFSWGMPAVKVCEKLVKFDSQICELKYEKVIDLNTVDLKKLKVKDLKKILSSWDERCEGCLEKTDFIKRIEELKPKYYKEEL